MFQHTLIAFSRQNVTTYSPLPPPLHVRATTARGSAFFLGGFDTASPRVHLFHWYFCRTLPSPSSSTGTTAPGTTSAHISPKTPPHLLCCQLVNTPLTGYGWRYQEKAGTKCEHMLTRQASPWSGFSNTGCLSLYAWKSR